MQLERAQQSLSFFNKNADKFKEQQGLIVAHDDYGSILHDVIDSLGLNDKATVLEVGPGEGLLLTELAAKFKKLIALDNSKEMLGGSGNVLSNLISLGTDAIYLSVTGKDNNGNKINLGKVYYSDKLFVTSHPETVYLTVVDENLNAVSFINSICHAFGSGICSENSGILFQNRAVNFRLEKNHPNCIDSNKRPLHTIIPGLLTNNSDETIMSYGVMGGQYQPVGQSHVLQNIFDFGMSMQEAIDAPRAFALNNKLKIENSFSKSSIENLSNLGHDIEIVDEGIGGGQGIIIDRKEGVLIGGSDPRKDGLAIGY